MDELKCLVKCYGFEPMNYYEGHYLKSGFHLKRELNPYCLVKSSQHEEKYFYVMLCGGSKLTYFSIDDLNKLLYREDGQPQTWIYHKYKKFIYSTQCGQIKERVMHFDVLGVERSREYKIVHLNKNRLDNRSSNLSLKYFLDRTYFFFEGYKLLFPNYFKKWYLEMKKNSAIPKYIHFNKYFYIMNHPLLLEKSINIFESDKEKNLITQFLQMENVLIFLENYPKNWNFKSLQAVINI